MTMNRRIRSGRPRGVTAAALVCFWAQALPAVACNIAPPAAVIVSPAAGASVGGEIAVYAKVSEETAVTGVRFLLDGSVLGGELATPPYSISWDTAGVADGAHTLTAQTLDATGRASYSEPVAVTVDNGQGLRNAPCAGLSCAGECAGADGYGFVIDACDEDIMDID